MSSDLSAILKRIQALRARAADAASTEAEAAIAARKAAELLAAHNISLSELDVRADGIDHQHWDSGQRTRPVEVFALNGVERLGNVKTWRAGGVISLVGAPQDVATALYFVDLVRHACRSTWATYQGTAPYFGQRARGASAREIGRAFRIGVAVRLGERFESMAKEQAAAPATTGRALVPVKNALIHDWMRTNGPKLRSARQTRVGSGYDDGRRAAEKVGLSRGVDWRRPFAFLR